MRSLFALLAILISMPALAQPAGMQMPPPPVEVTTVVRMPLFNSLSAVGTLSANEGVVVRPEISGLIKEIPFDEGQPIKAGQPLFVLDQDILSAEARRAKSSATLGSANLQRAQELKKSGYATQETLDTARQSAVANKADSTVAQAMLSKTIVRAPFDGLIGLRQVNLGDYVNVGQDLVNLEQVDPVKLDFTVPETFLASLHSGMPVSLTVDAYPGETFSGAIFAINPKVDPITRTIAARARIANPDSKLRPGLFARVAVPLASGSAAVLTVPETTLVPEGSKMLAYRVGADKNAQLVEVKMGQRSNGRVEVVSGLSEGDTVIVTGQMRVQDKKPVNVVSTIAPPTPVQPQPAPATENTATQPEALVMVPNNPVPAEVVLEPDVKVEATVEAPAAAE